MAKKFTPAALLLVLTLMLTLACSGDDSPAAPDTDRSQQELLERFDQMSNEVRDLREEVKGLQRVDETEQPSPQATELPPTQLDQPKETIQPVSPTLPPPPEVSSTENICDRSPAAQQALLRNLKISSCKAVTTEEIYRITNKLDPSFGISPRAGDFLGLVNVTHAEIHIREEADPAEIPANAFYGMERLKSLIIYVRAETTFRDGAFQGLPSLTVLAIEADAPTTMETGSLSGMPSLTALIIDADAPTTMETGSLSAMPSLEKLEMIMITPGHVMAGALRGLPNLEALTLGWHSPREEEEIKNNRLGELEELPSLKYLSIVGHVPSIGPTHFKKLPSLESLQIEGEGENSIELNQTSFVNSPNLKGIAIRASGAQATPALKNAFKSLHQLEELKISLSEQGKSMTVEVALSPNSPLMKDILNGDRKPDGYRVIPPGAD